MSDWIIYLVGGGVGLAILGYLWYTLRKGTLDAETITEVSANNQELQDKLAQQNQAVVDAEDRRRKDEKAADAKITNPTDAYDRLRGVFGKDPNDVN